MLKELKNFFKRSYIFCNIYVCSHNRSSFLLKLNSDFLLMCIIGFGSLFWIVRTVAFRSNLDKSTKNLYKKMLTKRL